MIRKKVLLSMALILLLSGYGQTEASGTSDAGDADEVRETAGGIRIETVKTGTFSMDWFKFGHGEKTFVILPGLSVQSVMEFADSIAEAYQQLTDDFTIYVFDRRNEMPEHYTVCEMAGDTAEAFRTLGLENISLFGASQGGMMAMEIAVTHPELTEALVLGSTSACVTDEQYQAIEKWIRLAKDKDAEGLYLAFGEAIYPPAVFEQSRDLLIEAAKTVTDEDLSRFIIASEGLKGFDIRNDLEKIDCPVLAIGDRDDRVLGADASEEIGEWMKNSPDFELFMYEGYGHAAYDLAPDYKEHILQFLLKDPKN